jgi:hypothetical protein
MCSAIGHVRVTPESDIKCDIWNIRFGQIVDIEDFGLHKEKTRGIANVKVSNYSCRIQQ